MKKIILVLDEVSKRVVKLDTSVINAGSITIVGDLQDITTDDMQDVISLVVLEGIAQCKSAIMRLQLIKEYYGLEIVMLGSDSQPAFKDICRLYKCNISVIDNDTINAAVFGDYGKEDDAVETKFSAVERFAQKVVAEDNVPDLKNLATAFLGVKEQNEFLASLNSTLQQQVINLETTMIALQKENERWSKGYMDIIERTSRLNQDLVRYEQIFSRDIYSKLSLHDYKSCPSIIYLKEYSDFSGRDLLVETLVDAFQIQRRKSAKVLCLFDSNTSRKVKLLPESYTILRNQYSMEQIVQSTYLCKTGNYSTVLEKLLNNRYGLDILIILDCKDYEDLVLTGDFPQFNLCNQISHARRLGLVQERTIVNTEEESWLNWQELDLSQFTRNEAFMKLSSRKVVQTILNSNSKYYGAI